MRILLLVLQFPPDINPTGILMAQLCEELQASGHEVTVITSFPHYEKFEIWKAYQGKFYDSSRQNGLEVLRLWVFANGHKQQMIYRLLSYLSFNILALFAILFSSHTYEVILSPNGSFFTGLTAYLGGKLRGNIPFIYNLQDLYPETFVHAGQLRNRWAIAILEKFERLMYRLASHITVVSPSFMTNVIAKGIAPHKVTLAPNFVDTEFIRPLPKENDFSRSQGLEGRFVVMYAGNLGYVYDFETLLAAAARLANYSDILFLIIGDGVAKTALVAKANALNLGNVRFLGFQPRETLPQLRAAADVQVSLYRHGSAKYSMPSKIYEVMASGRPLIASADLDSDVWKLVNLADCGVCVEPENVEQFTEALLAMYRHPLQCSAMARQGREQAEQHYSKAAVVQQYQLLFQRVIQSRPAGNAQTSHKVNRGNSREP